MGSVDRPATVAKDDGDASCPLWTASGRCEYLRPGPATPGRPASVGRHWPDADSVAAAGGITLGIARLRAGRNATRQDRLALTRIRGPCKATVQSHGAAFSDMT